MFMRYEPSLDGLRALAILAVVLLHLAEKFVPGGWVGVDVFFVLSGFLITKVLSAELADTGAIDFKKFYFFQVSATGACPVCGAALRCFAGCCLPAKSVHSRSFIIGIHVLLHELEPGVQ